jgi:hypothetical protein
VSLTSCAGPLGGRINRDTRQDVPIPANAVSVPDRAHAAIPSASSPVTLVLVVFHRSPSDTVCSHQATTWDKPEEALLADPVRRYSFLGLFRWEKSSTLTAQAASDEIQRRLGLDGVDLDRAEIHLRKDYGRRLSLVTTTGLGASAEDALQADYRLFGSWYVRSETRERGETFMELRREISFR